MSLEENERETINRYNLTKGSKMLHITFILFSIENWIRDSIRNDFWLFLAKTTLKILYLSSIKSRAHLLCRKMRMLRQSWEGKLYLYVEQDAPQYQTDSKTISITHFTRSHNIGKEASRACKFEVYFPHLSTLCSAFCVRTECKDCRLNELMSSSFLIFFISKWLCRTKDQT